MNSTISGGSCRNDENVLYEHEVVRLLHSWRDELQRKLVEHCGEERGNALFRRYAAVLPLAFQLIREGTFSGSS